MGEKLFTAASFPDLIAYVLACNHWFVLEYELSGKLRVSNVVDVLVFNNMGAHPNIMSICSPHCFGV